ncbi:hypothetical protein METBIDRAFT_42355 [Metschnikowia bicuspidata var. bicuspidata NRRL YB-4993]|uniref:LAA1-like C-terminal TPR repeats domain-containing protein n=1 Tax=Metschnikowia bicuspidata var. bicuspidata NRRL YB-4993 TaxID=869754 RepID=A0A1A0HAW7_9ASCO|nr:hypothetical protein METBIDRAFT_42355 [Metschnikowia bicuspidata var. bicuspidata NRRL YB-4993]OBA21156.1 hypothetical protein METBIDRAFT_42355 [Metschnikowia bicuspidata var. bicuspidata NRRL YB-4993]
MLALENERIITKKTSSPDATSEAGTKENVSSTAVKMLSRTMITVLEKLPSKVYDLSNNLLGELRLDEKGQFPGSGQIACIVLIDILETYPLHVASLINFAVTQIYKILKKNAIVSSNLVFLLSTVVKGALKSDIDEKFLAKIVKLVLKTISQHSILISELPEAALENGPSIPMVSYYIQALKNLLVLQASSHYETLLETSASSTSSSKLKPEAIMAQQDLFQQAILSTHEKVFLFGLQSQFSEVRSATVDLLANVLINFVATGKFSPANYLLGLYPMPEMNLWNESMTCMVGADAEPILDVKKEAHVFSNYDTEAKPGSTLNTLLLQVGVVEAFVFYVQLELLQDKDFLASSLTSLINSILFLFDDMSHVLHIQNGAWARTLSQWAKVVEFLITESGAQLHDTMARFVMLHFSSSQDESSRAENSVSKGLSNEKKRESGLFGFKALKKSKKKGLGQCQINLYTNPYQLNLALKIVTLLVSHSVDFNSLVHSKSNETLVGDVDNDDDEQVDEDENHSTTKRNSYVSDLLLSLLANESEYIRNYSLVCLLDYAAVNRSESNRLSLEVFAMVSQEFNSQNLNETTAPPTDRNITKSGITKLLSYALALLALIKQSDITLLQNSTVAKLVSFCTQNLKHNSSVGLKNIKNGGFWIILSALVTFYHESEFVKLNSSQFLVFWKNLLTSQFTTSALSGDSTLGNIRDVVQNLKLRTFSLLCLLNYISAVEATPELMKQLQFLLIKSQKYLVFLESEFGALGLVTGFNPQAFNESEYSPYLASNFLFSNYSEGKKLSKEHQLASLILYNKKIVMQGFVKIAHSLKGEVNSTLVILLLKIFADAKLFSRHTSSDTTKDKSKIIKSKQPALKFVHQDDSFIFLEEDCNYNFGVTSKFLSDTPKIDEICYRDKLSQLLREGMPYTSSFFREPAMYFESCIENLSASDILSWSDAFESMQNLTACHSINFDPATLILNRYSLCHEYSTNVITSLVDLSIELFQLVFIGLSYKIQFSLLEQLRSSLSVKQVDPLRRKALMINIGVAVHGLLSHTVKTKMSLSEDLVLLLLEIIDLIDSTDPALVSICADLVGLAAHLLEKPKVEEVIATIIGKIVIDSSPFHRGRCVFSLAKINHYTHSGFIEIHDVMIQLIKDAHPVISYYSLRAATILFENPLGNQSLIEEILTLTYSNFISDSLSLTDSNIMYTNLRSKYGFASTVASLVRVCITSLGPRVRDCHTATKTKIFQILLLLSRGIRCLSMNDLLNSVSTVLLACQELIIFDPALTRGFAKWFKKFALVIVQSNLKIGIGNVRPTSINLDQIFSFTTSQELLQQALVSLAEMTKVGIKTLGKESLNLAWVLMEIKPCRELKSLISYWIDYNPEANWFHQLTQLFNMSSRKLTGKFIEINYQQKLLPFQQRHKKVNTDANFLFTDEEAQNIVETHEEMDNQNQPINWDFRLLIYDLLIKFLSDSKKNPHLAAKLEPKIQEIVRISFLGTATPIVSIKIKGVELLSNALDVFGHLEDPLYPGVSILEQQQAQIISALIPCFSSDSDASVIVEAIDVSSKFINLPRINFYSKQRILRTMIYLLEEVSSNKFLKFVHLETMAEYGRKAIQLSILNCWAVLHVNFATTHGTSEPEFEEILQKYSKLLISLWILVLKELSSLRYNQPNSKDLELYENYWLNFVGVLSLILEKDASAIQNALQDEEDNFFFVMFCQCSEALIKNHNVSQVLKSVNRLVRVPGLAMSLFYEDVFGEVIDLLDRLILMEKETETKCEVIETVSVLFEAFSKISKPNDSSFVKYSELMRVAMLPLFEIFPFLRQDFDPEDESSKILLKRCGSQSSLTLASKEFAVLARMMQGFSQESKSDLISCMFYLIAKFFEFGNDALIGATLPFLKTIVSQARNTNDELLCSFVKVLKSNGLFGSAISKKTYIITMVILITGGNVTFDEQEISSFSQSLVDGISDDDLASMSIQSIKSIINHAGLSSASATVTKAILRGTLDSLLNYDDQQEVVTKVKFEIVYMFNQSLLIDEMEKGTAFTSLIIPLLINYDERGVLSRDYLHEKMLDLMNSRIDSFKKVVVEQLNDEQRKAAEALVTHSKQRADGGADSGSIELKSFA